MFVENADRDKFRRDAQEFGSIKRNVDIVILASMVKNLKVFGYRGLKEEFDEGYGCGPARIVDSIATNSATNAVRNSRFIF